MTEACWDDYRLKNGSNMKFDWDQPVFIFIKVLFAILLPWMFFFVWVFFVSGKLVL